MSDLYKNGVIIGIEKASALTEAHKKGKSMLTLSESTVTNDYSTGKFIE